MHVAEPELKGPVKGALYFHRAVISESRELREIATALDFEDMNGAAALAKRFAALNEALKFHEDGEDLAVFPPLESRFTYIADTYEYDHKRHREHSDEFANTLSELQKAP